jgi:O-antigen ligase
VTILVEGALDRDRITPSESLRMEYWRSSLAAISEAPLIGHGTGYIRNAFAKIRAERQGGPAVANNPHNQTFAIGIQLGLAGVLLLYAMWLSHVLLFRGSGWPARLGLLVVVQSVVASTFNSHLSDFTAGWLYVFGVGILGGAAIRERTRA